MGRLKIETNTNSDHKTILVSAMTSMVERLQRATLDPNVPVSNLLRQVKLIAAKLKLGTIENWVEHELNGYDGEDVPDYRIVKGAPKAFNPYNGWIPIVLEDLNWMEMISARTIGQKISELEDILENGSGETLQVPFPQHIIAELNRGADIHLPQMALIVGRASVAGILDAVRNKILDWSIELEKTGIKGSDISFSPEEKSLAQQPNVTMNIGSIGNFVGNLGVGNSAQDISAAIDSKAVESLVDQLRRQTTELINQGIDDQQLEKILREIEILLRQTKPDQTRLRSVLSDLRAIITGATGNLVASGAIQIVNQLLGTGVPTP